MVKSLKQHKNYDKKLINNTESTTKLSYIYELERNPFGLSL
jgi:hypothetical protein